MERCKMNRTFRIGFLGLWIAVLATASIQAAEIPLH